MNLDVRRRMVGPLLLVAIGMTGQGLISLQPTSQKDTVHFPCSRTGDTLTFETTLPDGGKGLGAVLIRIPRTLPRA